MAQYHSKAAILKPEIEAQNFTAEQFSTILKMMRGCTMLRQGKVIESFLECMIPEGMEIKQGKLREGKFGQYRLSYVVKCGESIPIEADTPEGEEN